MVYICSKYTDQEIAKSQKLGSENKVVDINLNPLSNSTFISTINLQKLQDNKHNNKKVIQINYNIKKKVFFNFCPYEIVCRFVDFTIT